MFYALLFSSLWFAVFLLSRSRASWREVGLTRHHPPSQVVDAFGVDFKYRRFDAREAAPRNADLLAGTKRVAAVHPWEARQAASPPPPPCLPSRLAPHVAPAHRHCRCGAAQP